MSLVTRWDRMRVTLIPKKKFGSEIKHITLFLNSISEIKKASFK